MHSKGGYIIREDNLWYKPGNSRRCLFGAYNCRDIPKRRRKYEAINLVECQEDGFWNYSGAINATLKLNNVISYIFT